jgi:hypothetical protein
MLPPTAKSSIPILARDSPLSSSKVSTTITPSHRTHHLPGYYRTCPTTSKAGPTSGPMLKTGAMSDGLVVQADTDLVLRIESVVYEDDIHVGVEYHPICSADYLAGYDESLSLPHMPRFINAAVRRGIQLCQLCQTQSTKRSHLSRFRAGSNTLRPQAPTHSLSFPSWRRTRFAGARRGQDVVLEEVCKICAGTRRQAALLEVRDGVAHRKLSCADGTRRQAATLRWEEKLWHWRREKVRRDDMADGALDSTSQLPGGRRSRSWHFQVQAESPRPQSLMQSQHKVSTFEFEFVPKPSPAFQHPTRLFRGPSTFGIISKPPLSATSPARPQRFPNQSHSSKLPSQRSESTSQPVRMPSTLTQKEKVDCWNWKDVLGSAHRRSHGAGMVSHAVVLRM